MRIGSTAVVFTAGEGGSTVVAPRRMVGGLGGGDSPEIDLDRQAGRKACPGRGDDVPGGMTSTSAGRSVQGRSCVLNECNWTRGPENKWLRAA